MGRFLPASNHIYVGGGACTAPAGGACAAGRWAACGPANCHSGNESLRVYYSRVGEANSGAQREEHMSRSLPNRALHAVFSRVNRRRQWWELPTTALKTLNLLS